MLFVWRKRDSNSCDGFRCAHDKRRTSKVDCCHDGWNGRCDKLQLLRWLVMAIAKGDTPLDTAFTLVTTIISAVAMGIEVVTGPGKKASPATDLKKQQQHERGLFRNVREHFSIFSRHVRSFGF